MKDPRECLCFPVGDESLTTERAAIQQNRLNPMIFRKVLPSPSRNGQFADVIKNGPRFYQWPRSCRPGTLTADSGPRDHRPLARQLWSGPPTVTVAGAPQSRHGLIPVTVRVTGKPNRVPSRSSTRKPPAGHGYGWSAAGLSFPRLCTAGLTAGGRGSATVSAMAGQPLQIAGTGRGRTRT